MRNSSSGRSGNTRRDGGPDKRVKKSINPRSKRVTLRGDDEENPKKAAKPALGSFKRNRLESEKPKESRFNKARNEKDSDKRSAFKPRAAKGEGLGEKPVRFRPKKDASQHNKFKNPGELRLNQYLSKAGICSRREADKLIQEGLVSVNGVIVTELGVKVRDSDLVKYDGSRVKPERKVYILLNKPKDTVTTLSDPHAKFTVFDCIKGACEERIYPVGRLDRNTTGILLLTNDGEMTAKLTHPKFMHKKVYHVFLDKPVTKGDLEKLAEGFELEDGFIQADEVSYVDAADKKQVGVEIHSGRNRIVRRMFEHLGYDVVKLDRVLFAGLTKAKLARGKWRFLNEKEIAMLKMIK
jgi:23S rRNA pseudouridine2605 synthase